MNRSPPANHDVEAPSYHRVPPKSVRDPMFEEDVQDFKPRKGPAYSRAVLSLLGIVTLVAVAIGAYLLLAKDGIDLQKGKSQHDNFQGTVSMETIAMHAVPSDCWLAIHHNVYDLTEYAPTHPGPDSLITDHCGTDATAVYDSVHSIALLPTVNEFLLGTLQSDGAPAPTPGSDSGSGSGPTGGISLTTIESHAVASDCWMAIHGNVYDMTEYAPMHPGPSTLITSHCGTDATGPYAREHSKGLLPAVSGFQVGTLQGAPAPAPTPSSGAGSGSASEISLTTIKIHAFASDCWMAIHGNVYDMTQYAPTHPGPSTLITNHCGTDATGPYAREHSRGLLPAVSGFQVGTLQGFDPSQNPIVSEPEETSDD